MKHYIFTSLLLAITGYTVDVFAQNIDKKTIENISKEAHQHSQLEILGQELCDDIGPRLIGSPSYIEAQNWIGLKYETWGISHSNKNYGRWQSWERGTSSATLTYPRVVDLNATQLSWSPSTPNGKPIEAEVVMIPTDLKDSINFAKWLPSVKNKIVMISQPESSGRPFENWEKNGMVQYLPQVKATKDSLKTVWNNNLKTIGYNNSTIQLALEKAGAKALLSSNWANGWGSQRIFDAKTKNIPNMNISLEDYAMLYRFIQRGIKPKVNLIATSKDNGLVHVSNTMGEIRGVEKPDEYIMLSAHLDSWDGGTGATDNATGTILMMEVMRILKKHYPNPKRSIIVGHWGGEEQGLNGSRGYIADHPEMRDKISVLFNQDNGTGRISNIRGNGFLDAYDYFGRWLQYIPEASRKEIKTEFPGNPGGRGGSDYAAFLPYDIPAFFLLGHAWDYGAYTWHTQYDTYDKIVFEDMRMNAETIAILVYLACEEPEMFSRRKAQLPLNIESGKRAEWPTASEAIRTGRK